MENEIIIKAISEIIYGKAGKQFSFCAARASALYFRKSLMSNIEQAEKQFLL